MAGRILVVRDSAWTGRYMRIAIRVDGARVVRVSNDTWLDFDVEPGTHRLRATQFGSFSKALVVDVADGQTIVLRTRMRSWAGFLFSMGAGLTVGNGFWMARQGPTPAALALFAAGVVGMVATAASGLLISLRPDPAARSRAFV